MKYDDVALGVECALPREINTFRRPDRFGWLVKWLFAALKRRT